ncbi:aminodeoxychorismate synthase component I [Methyloligella sp. 2.7D]|uniref:aminodeoxychorismate synthase component I n=1 Tax=unclassified Methyloligella TaxID=2625955 RepID=UPI00157C7DDB|nr:aminodeoxychorismate synthase component I [Methyloligella sp. GL2]QKP77769.1 aminodeoxychorismate synthase component I [Methyloligella sp. GL2]
MSTSPYVLLDDSLTPGGVCLLYREPLEIIVCNSPDEVEEKIEAVSQGLKRGLYAAGFFSYELGYCMEPKLAGLMPMDRNQPLFWIGLFRGPQRFNDAETKDWLDRHGGREPAEVHDLRLSWEQEEYAEAFAKVKQYIAAGDVYQINLTLKYFFGFDGDPVALYSALRRKQRVSYGALISAEDFQCLSFSPELFFKQEGDEIATRPMKGTAPRGRTPREDGRLKTWLAVDEKQRAENLMIVDLLRNDVGRLAKIGSVEVTDLFTVETYRTVHQMTSGIRAKLRAELSLAQMLKALFPSGSVTGAPKVRAMEIIRELEALPRGVYTGAVGTIAPTGDAEFNVAIRTLMLHGHDGHYQGEMGIGSGVVADSKADAEYEECLLKGEFLTKPAESFELIETIRWEREHGFYLLDRHLSRLQASAHHFGYPFDRNDIRAALAAHAERLEGQVHMVRLLLAEDGAITVTSTEIALPAKGTVWRFVVSDKPVDETDPFFFHKTTHRQFYDGELARQKERTGCDEVVFVNSKGELTEGTRTNLFLEQDGRLYTPAVACGLLPGTLREELLDLPRVEASEAILTLEDLARADRIYLGNSVRGLILAELQDAGGETAAGESVAAES